MAAAFEDTIRRLWRLLDLREPMFAAAASIVLNVDGLEVELADADNGEHLLICAQAGRLSLQANRRSAQIERILGSNLAHLATNPACVCLAAEDSEAPQVLVRARCRYDRFRIDRLTAAITSVAAIAYLHASELAERDDTAQRRRIVQPAQTAGAENDLMIFQP